MQEPCLVEIRRLGNPRPLLTLTETQLKLPVPSLNTKACNSTRSGSVGLNQLREHETVSFIICL
jgi:hypothetical protein